MKLNRFEVVATKLSGVETTLFLETLKSLRYQRSIECHAVGCRYL